MKTNATTITDEQIRVIREGCKDLPASTAFWAEHALSRTP